MFPNGERAFTQVAFIDRERSPARALGKGSRLDIVARLDEEMVNLEVQVRHEPGYLKRTLYYWSLLYSTSLERRGKYIDTVRTISLGLLDFELLPEERECRNSYSIRNDASGRPLCDDLQIIYFELPKARRERKAGCRCYRVYPYLRRRSRSHWASLRHKRPAQHPKAVPSGSWPSAYAR